MTSGRKRRSPTQRPSPGTCPSTTNSGRGCIGTSAKPELVEIGYFVALTMGQQRWLRTLDIEHHQMILPGTDASMAPGFANEEELRRSKSSPDYLARKSRRSEAAE
jgi:hypothetical protein